MYNIYRDGGKLVPVYDRPDGRVGGVGGVGPGVCTVGLLSYNCQCCFKKSGPGLVSVNTANKIVKNDKV